MMIIIILLGIILLSLKLKISIYLKIENFDTFVKLKIGFIEIKRKGTLVKRKRKYQIKNSKKKVKFNFANLKKMLKYIEVNKLNINLILGTPFLLFNVFAVPFMASILELVRMVQFKKLKSYSYTVLPNYNEFRLFSEVEAVLKIRAFHIVLLVIKSLRVVHSS